MPSLPGSSSMHCAIWHKFKDLFRNEMNTILIHIAQWYLNLRNLKASLKNGDSSFINYWRSSWFLEAIIRQIVNKFYNNFYFNFNFPRKFTQTRRKKTGTNRKKSTVGVRKKNDIYVEILIIYFSWIYYCISSIYGTRPSLYFPWICARCIVRDKNVNNHLSNRLFNYLLKLSLEFLELLE